MVEPEPVQPADGSVAFPDFGVFPDAAVVALQQLEAGAGVKAALVA